VHDDRPPGNDPGARKERPGVVRVREANVSYDHPYDLPLEHALNIDFVNEALGPGVRVAVELSVDAARQLVKTIEAVLARRPARRAGGPAGRSGGRSRSLHGVTVSSEPRAAGPPLAARASAGTLTSFRVSRVLPAFKERQALHGEPIAEEVVHLPAQIFGEEQAAYSGASKVGLRASSSASSTRVP